MIKEIISKIKTTFNNNPMLFLFIIASLINSILLRVVTIKNYFALKPVFIDLALLLLIASFSFLIKKKNLLEYCYNDWEKSHGSFINILEESVDDTIILMKEKEKYGN